MTPNQIVDQIGKLRAQYAPFIAKEEKLRKELIKLARHKPKIFDGKAYRAAVIIMDQLCYDTKKLDKHLSDALRKKCKSKRHSECVRVSALKKQRGRKA